MNGRFEVQHFGCRAVVMKDGAKVWGPGPIAQAEESRDRLERKAKRRVRPCISCCAEFMSEGAHHRMCKDCRSKASNMYDGAV